MVVKQVLCLGIIQIYVAGDNRVHHHIVERGAQAQPQRVALGEQVIVPDLCGFQGLRLRERRLVAEALGLGEAPCAPHRQVIAGGTKQLLDGQWRQLPRQLCLPATPPIPVLIVIQRHAQQGICDALVDPSQHGDDVLISLDRRFDMLLLILCSRYAPFIYGLEHRMAVTLALGLA